MSLTLSISASLRLVEGVGLEPTTRGKVINLDKALDLSAILPSGERQLPGVHTHYLASAHAVKRGAPLTPKTHLLLFNFGCFGKGRGGQAHPFNSITLKLKPNGRPSRAVLSLSGGESNPCDTLPIICRLGVVLP